ncbi:MAG: phosphatase PAP2 family protein [Acidimicrobiales bacterium]|nr:phosphatase PAP2 family protein [Acidimicrobiales bacterium]
MSGAADRRFVPSLIAGRVLETVLLHGLRPGRRSTRRTARVVSEVTRGGRLWFGITAAGAAAPHTRAAGRDGVAAWTLASGAAFGIKSLVQRRRPVLVRTIGASTSSSSMPSSHTAGAFAYATAATLRAPAMGVVLVPLAVATGWSRAATARHFPTDVAAGAVLGVVVGACAHRAADAWAAREAPAGTD